MQGSYFLAVLSIFSWIVSAQAQTVTETKSNGPTVVVVFTSSNGGPASLTTITTLSGLPVPTNFTSSSSSRTPTVSSTVLESPHVKSPVAMVAGSLSGFIAIFAAVIVVIVVRRRRSGKRSRRRTSVIMALEAQHPGSFVGNVRVASPAHGDNVDSGGSDSGSFSARLPSARSSSGAGTTLHESGRSVKNSTKKSRSRNPSNPTKAIKNNRRSDDLELDWRDSNSPPFSRLDRTSNPLPPSPSQGSTVPTFNNSHHNTAINPTASTSAGTDAKPDSHLQDVYPPRVFLPPSQSSRTHMPDPSSTLNAAPGRPPPGNMPQGDLPPAYEDVR
ncbi:hypothetical protein GALMADRAFT_219109 [Galerina marginata CBS 339.88]|uniref:Mid2 domain-containing protein n=1 Tax=Galerina marginata (strain CBS 339.88) TaxID=685588 RepID=A0A067U3S3_GALM3|nr:hypothetical protein GALMADRAFT_219109 [Galerina marginata CBS 339.88]